MNKIIALLLVVVVSHCEFGVDLSTLTSITSFQCLLQNHTFLNVRAWRSYGAFDPNSIQTLSNAKAAGFKPSNIGIYMFPCFSQEKSASSQVNEMVKNL